MDKIFKIDVKIIYYTELLNNQEKININNNNLIIKEFEEDKKLKTDNSSNIINRKTEN